MWRLWGLMGRLWERLWRAYECRDYSVRLGLCRAGVEEVVGRLWRGGVYGGLYPFVVDLYIACGGL